MEPATLSFSALDAKIQTLPEFPSDNAIFPKKAKWGFSAAAIGALFGLLITKLLPSDAAYTLVIAYISLTVEIAGVVVAGISLIPTKWPTFANERRDFVEQLDFDLPHHLALVEWLRACSISPRSSRCRALAARW